MEKQNQTIQNLSSALLQVTKKPDYSTLGLPEVYEDPDENIIEEDLGFEEVELGPLEHIPPTEIPEVENV